MRYRLLFAMLSICLGAAAQVAEPVPKAEPFGMTLQEVQRRVVASGRDVAAARRLVAGAQADKVTAAVTPAPQLSVNTQSINPNQMGRGGLWSRPVDTIVRLEKTLERGDKARLRTEVAEAALGAARLDLAEVTRSQQVVAADAYWRLKLAQVQWDIANRNATLANQGRDVAQQRLAQGDLSRLEATRLSVEAERAANDLAQAALQLRQARLRLQQVLALEADATVAQVMAADDWPSALTPAGDTAAPNWTNEALLRRPDVRAAQQRVQQAEAALALAQAQQKADVTVGVQFEHDPPVGQRLWGVGVSVPLGVADRQAGPLARAAVQLEDARAERERVEAAARTELEGLSAAWQTAQARLARIEAQLLPQAREALQASEYARTHGALGLQDLLDARRTLYAAELEHASAQAEFAVARSALLLALSPVVATDSDSSDSLAP